MRVLLLCNEFPPRPHGGIGTFCLNYARGLRAAGHSVTVIEVQGASSPGNASDVPVHRIGEWPIRPGRAVLSRCRLAMALPAICRRSRPHLIEVPDFGGWLPYLPPPVPLVVRLHGSTTLIAPHNDDRVRPVTRWFERRTLGRARLWIAPSKHILDATTAEFGVSPPHAEVIYNPLPSQGDTLAPAALHHIPAGPIVLFAGWINKAKGALALAHALPRVFQRMPQVQSVFVGADVQHRGQSSKAQILATVGERFASNVHFPGQVSRAEVGGWMRAASVFVLPSRFESFGLVYLEAIRAGLPVVASNRSAEPELFEHADGVTLVDPDSPPAIANAILGVLADRERIASKVAEGRDGLLSRFTIERCVSESVHAYEKVLR